MGLCFEAKDDEILARGWPNLITTVDAHVHDKNPAKAGLRAHGASDPIYFGVWPRATLHRYLRIESEVAKADASTYNERQQQIATLAKKGALNDAPLDDTEALAALASTFRCSDEIYPFQTYALVYGVEAIAGTDAVLDAITSALATLSKWKDVTAAQASMAGTLAFLLLRASPSARKKARGALEAVRERAPKTLADDGTLLAQSIDCALRGGATVKALTASGDEVELDGAWGLNPRPLIEYADDAALVRELVARADEKSSMTCGDTKYRAGGSCNLTNDFEGVCDQNGKQTSSFHESTPCTCEDASAIAQQALTACTQQ